MKLDIFALFLVLSSLMLSATTTVVPLSMAQELTSTNTTPSVAHFNETEHKGRFKWAKGHGGRGGAARLMLDAGDLLGMMVVEIGLLMLVAGVMAVFA